MEAAIRWSPNSNLSEQRFLLADVTGRAFNLAKITSYSGKSLKYDLLPTYQKVPPFRAFDWAPFDENLVAVGQWSGEATLLRIDGGAGPVSLPTKHQRLCNAVAFSRMGLLATGLERVRNAECLNLWDVSQRLPPISSPGGRAAKSAEPYRKYSSSEAISSIKFLIRQPEVLIAGVKGVGIRIYDLRDSTGNASLQFQTSRVHNVAIDSLNENYFACCGTGKDMTIQMWDCRSGSPHTPSGVGAGGDQSNQTCPVVEYSEAFSVARNASPATIWSLRYCKGKSGVLGALASNGELKVFETSHGYSRADTGNEAQPTPSPFAERLVTKFVHGIEHAFDDVHQPRQESERIVSFDFTNLAGSKGTPSALILRGNGNIGIHELSGPPTAFSLSAWGALSVSNSTQAYPKSRSESLHNDTTICTYVPHLKKTTVTVPDDGRRRGDADAQLLQQSNVSNLGVLRNDLPSSRETHERAIATQSKTRKLGMAEALASLSLARQRCAEGYGLDVVKNLRVVGSDRWLSLMWTWIERAQNNSKNNGMVADGLDLSYIGVFNIWRSDMSSDQVPRRPPEPNAKVDFTNAVISLAQSLDLPKFTTVNTDSPEHRQVCLYTCGLGLSTEQVEAVVRDLTEDGQKTKAAAFAVVYGQLSMALQALRTGKVSAIERELSLALAGYVKGSSDDTWYETIQDLSTDLTDPYARAILALVSHGSWHDVLKETSLPIRDRVGIALMYLPDDELTLYINTITSSAIKAGDIEGIVLTGLTQTSVPLFENYIKKFIDLQTPVLALAFASPRYFADRRVIIWRETYRAHLDRFGMFLQRAQFDVQSSNLSSGPDGLSTLSPPARQISLRCTYCDQSLDRNPDHGALPSSDAVSRGTHSGSIFGNAARSGTACPKCGRHMPRCVICMNWVGMPDQQSKGAVAKKTGKDEAMESFVSVCQGCWHVSHAGHAEEWFRRHRVCPASGCDCQCVEVDVGVA